MFDVEMSIHKFGGYTKEDVVAMLEDLKQDIIAESWHIECYDVNANDLVVQISDVDKVIQQKIDTLKDN